MWEVQVELKDQVIIVTGAASGIGKESAMALARKGAKILAADFNDDGAQSLAAQLREEGTQAFAFKVDVSNAEQVKAMVDFAVDKFGTLNGIFNNAGIGLVKPFLEMDPASYLKVIDVDQHSVYYGMYYAAKKMVAIKSKGAFVNTASIYGTMAALGSFNYNAAKAAVVMMSKSAALELAPHGIECLGRAHSRGGRSPRRSASVDIRVGAHLGRRGLFRGAGEGRRREGRPRGGDARRDRVLARRPLHRARFRPHAHQPG